MKRVEISPDCLSTIAQVLRNISCTESGYEIAPHEAARLIEAVAHSARHANACSFTTVTTRLAFADDDAIPNQVASDSLAPRQAIP